jgi:DNA-binding CsgD family transcriptional regulator
MILDKSLVCPVLIGREHDLQGLDRLMTHLQEGRGQIALISGEAGIGKSRLVREAKARAPQGTMIIEGACFQTDSVLPYAPLLDLFRNFFGKHSPEEISRLLEPWVPQLVKLFPELNRYLPDLRPAATMGPDPEQEKRRLFQALVQTLSELAQRGPLIVILEDLHWSDSTSLEFLLLLARRIPALPVLLLLTYRGEDTTPELTHFLAGLDRERLATELALQPMSSPEVEAMLQATLASPQAPVSKDFLDTIFGLTEGNPFFIEEILKALSAEGDISYANGVWDQKELNLSHIPRTVQDAVQRRTQQLDEGTLRALRLASVMGRRFNFRLLQELLDVDEADLMALLKKLITAQLVVEETADQFAFRHALTRQAIYNTLLLRERQGLHRSVAEAIEQKQAAAGATDTSMDVHAADLSLHYYAGAAWEKALEYSQRAGDRARSFYAQREAVVYYSRAIVSTRQLNRIIEPELLCARGRAYDILSDFKSALDDFEQALKIAHQQGDGQAEWQTLIEIGSLWADHDLQRAGEFYRQAEELARKLNQPRLLAHSLNYVGNWFFVTGQTIRAIEYHRQALEFFEGEHDERGMAETHDGLGMAILHHGDQIAAYEEYRHAIRLFRKLDNKHALIPALLGACHALYDDTDFIPAQSRLESQGMAMEALELARQIGWASDEAFAEWGLALNLVQWGMFEDALAHIASMFRIATEIENPQRLAGAYYALGHIYLLMLRADLAIQNLEVGLKLARELGSTWLIGNITTDLANAYLLKKDTDRARALLASVVQKETGHYTRVERRMLWVKGCLLLAEREPAQALRIAEHLLDSKRSSHEGQPIPALLKLKGEALLALNRLEKAGQALEAAKRGAEQREALPVLWQIHGQLGWLYKQQKNSENAESEFASARQLLHALAGNIQDEALRAGFLQAALETLPGERTPPRRQGQAEQFGGLTPREREVAGLLSQGKSNREIAGDLVLSERTVENHISNILTKLGFTSRAQIAVWAVEKGLGASGKN